MIDIYLQDNCFYGDLGCSKMNPPKNIRWIRTPPKNGMSTMIVDTVFFTDYCLNQSMHPSYKNMKKIAWLIEPYIINPHSYEYVKKHYNDFDLILTHHVEYLSIAPNFEFYPSAMCWIEEKDWGKVDKTKNISIFASAKNFVAGHQLRHQIIKIVKDKIDIYGFGYNPVVYKYDGLKDYRFSVAIENCRINHYFTEKLIDCFATYTIPIYWGCPEIGKFFNPDGIIQCNNAGDLIRAIDSVNQDAQKTYDEKFKAVEENFEIAKDYANAEDWIFKRLLKKVVKYEKNYSNVLS